MKNLNKSLLTLLVSLVSFNNFTKSPEAKPKKPIALHADDTNDTFSGDEEETNNDKVTNHPKTLLKLSRCQQEAIHHKKIDITDFKASQEVLIKCLEQNGHHAEAHAIKSVQLDDGSVNHFVNAAVQYPMIKKAYEDEETEQFFSPDPLDRFADNKVNLKEAVACLDKENFGVFAKVLKSIDLSKFKTKDKKEIESMLSSLLLHEAYRLSQE